MVDRISIMAAPGDPDAVAEILHDLPEWFGRPESTQEYIEAIERDLTMSGTRMLTVKTVGAADPDEGYQRTRLFYEAVGFLSLEEFDDLWDGTPCLFMAKPLA